MGSLKRDASSEEAKDVDPVSVLVLVLGEYEAEWDTAKTENNSSYNSDGARR